MTERARDLHDAFDRSFAVAPPPPEPAHSDFLCIRIAGEPSAIPLGDIASLHADLRVVALPTRAPELLGVAAIRAAIVPIYDLAAALGMARAGANRWTALVRGGAVGFAFEGYDGHARIADRTIATATASSAERHVRGQYSAGGQSRFILDLPSVLAAIEARWSPRNAKEP